MFIVVLQRNRDILFSSIIKKPQVQKEISEETEETKTLIASDEKKIQDIYQETITAPETKKKRKNSSDKHFTQHFLVLLISFYYQIFNLGCYSSCPLLG